ncbi:MAG: hypothetical protein AAFU41_11065 [Pseudomonadota bacterium]
MTVEPDFPLHGRLNEALTKARGPQRVPEGKGGHVFVDGQLYRILDIKSRIFGRAAFGYSVNEKELVHLCDHVDVGTLGFKGLRTTTISPLLKLTQLRMLSLWWVQKLADISPLAGMDLEVLVLDDIRNNQDIAAVGEIAGLRALTVSGAMHNDHKIASLLPLTQLDNLEELKFIAMKLDDDTLRPLAECPALRDAQLANTYPTEDYAYLTAKRPDLRSTALAAYQPAGQGKEVMVTGRRKPFLHLEKDAERLAKYQAKWDALVAGFAADA